MLINRKRPLSDVISLISKARIRSLFEPRDSEIN